MPEKICQPHCFPGLHLKGSCYALIFLQSVSDVCFYCFSCARFVCEMPSGPEMMSPVYPSRCSIAMQKPAIPIEEASWGYQILGLRASGPHNHGAVIRLAHLHDIASAQYYKLLPQQIRPRKRNQSKVFAFNPGFKPPGGVLTLTTKTAGKEAIPSKLAMASFRFSFILIHHPVRLVDPIFILKLPIADCKIHRDDTFFV